MKYLLVFVIIDTENGKDCVCVCVYMLYTVVKWIILV